METEGIFFVVFIVIFVIVGSIVYSHETDYTIKDYQVTIIKTIETKDSQQTLLETEEGKRQWIDEYLGEVGDSFIN